jgi:tRNA threonylcarbamoyladenosine biosynthesis protein TsaE
VIRWSFVSRDPEQTRAVARELGRAIGADGLIVALIGPLGAGKTVFVKGLAEGLGVEPRAVSSPTFVIAQQYAVPTGPEVLHHVDLYRIESEDELEAIGFDDLLAPGSVLAVEWADRFPGLLGRDVLRVEFEGPGDSAAAPRRIHVEVEGLEQGLAARVGEDWRRRVASLESREREAAGGSASSSDGLLALLLAGVVGLAAVHDAHQLDLRLDLAAGRPGDAPPCASMAPARDDALDAFGTRRLRCAVDAGADVSAPRVEGLARLLAGGKLDINHASARQLEALPGIGPTRAAAILAHRAHSPFPGLTALEAVPGIGPATRRRLAPWVEVGTIRPEGQLEEAGGGGGDAARPTATGFGGDLRG